ncbi:nucleotide sugar dehydrogenase [Planomicrobium sp. CPCC 101079]|uniref:nucleotide sugar dehydrogenase n=1 Tax=Planomicrobium sp. CPCC 101079 TaxID=2599618 RepID=UPI0011B82D64|nr:nucleotide sugar dehydrogenase [Planomicrobium sp. CPCC 101079]TWT03754.1 nucleotide sugar dehydrogenase [Planomicrobium sp. CPCC 101079]
MIDKLKIAVVGLGDAGLPVAIEFGKKYSVIGFDSETDRIEALNEGFDYISEMMIEDLKKVEIDFSDDPIKLNDAGFIIIAVPTIVNSSNYPDFAQVLEASKTVGKHMRKGVVVVYESTFYPGLTEEKCIPVLEKYSGLEAGEEFFVGYSQEQIKPYENKEVFSKAKRVVAGQSKEVSDFIAEVYGKVAEAGVYKAKSIRIAETAKIFESVQRDVNFALMNELALICHKLEIDTQDVLETVSIKKKFQKFAPSLIGGSSISNDPYFLAYKGIAADHYPVLTMDARRINEQMGTALAQIIVKKIVEQSYSNEKSRVTVLGFTDKEDEPNAYNIQVVDMIRELQEFGLDVQVADPLAHPEKAESLFGFELTPHSDLLPASAVILAVPHMNYKKAGWQKIEQLLINKEGIVFDIHCVLDKKEKPANIELWRL